MKAAVTAESTSVIRVVSLAFTGSCGLTYAASVLVTGRADPIG